PDSLGYSNHPDRETAGGIPDTFLVHPTGCLTRRPTHPGPAHPAAADGGLSALHPLSVWWASRRPPRGPRRACPEPPSPSPPPLAHAIAGATIEVNRPAGQHHHLGAAQLAQQELELAKLRRVGEHVFLAWHRQQYAPAHGCLRPPFNPEIQEQRKHHHRRGQH